MSAIGGLAGAFFARRIADWLGQGPTIWIAVLVRAPFGFVTPFVPARLVLWACSPSRSWSFMACVVVYNVAQVSFRQGLTRTGCSAG